MGEPYRPILVPESRVEAVERFLAGLDDNQESDPTPDINQQ